MREALWGAPAPFDQASPFYLTIQQLATLRDAEPALRYGRFYFRPIAGDGQHFGISSFPQGILAFSRILVDEEVVVVANTSTSDARSFEVIVDLTLTKPGDQYRVRYSNKATFHTPGVVQEKPAGSVSVEEAARGSGVGPLHAMRVSLAPLEVQILSR